MKICSILLMAKFSKNFLYEDHAMPYWMSYGKLFVIQAFAQYTLQFLKSFSFKKKKKSTIFQNCTIKFLLILEKLFPRVVKNIIKLNQTS